MAAIRHTTMTTSKTAVELDLMYFNNIIEPCFKITSIINELSVYIIYKRERGASSSLALRYSCVCLLAAILANPCQSPHIGWWCTTWFIGQCVVIGMCWLKRPPKPTCHDEVGCAIVRAAAAYFVVVVCLSYNSQVVEYNAPTTPKPCEAFPQFFATIKRSPETISTCESRD